jgi:hypothetical protein
MQQVWGVPICSFSFFFIFHFSGFRAGLD